MKTLSIIFLILLFVSPKLASTFGLLVVLGFLCGLLKLNITYTVSNKDKEKESD